MPKGNPAGYFKSRKSSGKRSSVREGSLMGAPKMGAMQTPARLASTKRSGGRSMRGKR